jgi:hypothetical protein
MTSSRRLRSETVSMSIEVGDGRHLLDVSLVYDGGGHLHELAFVGRGKVGLGLDLLLADLGIKVSRAIQGRNPDTGAAA